MGWSVESVVVTVVAVVVGVILGWWARSLRSRRPGVHEPWSIAPDDPAALRDEVGPPTDVEPLRSRLAWLENQVGDLRLELSARYAEVVGLRDSHEDAQAALSRAQVDLANRTAELIAANENLERFRQAVVDRFGDAPALPPPPPDSPARWRVPRIPAPADQHPEFQTDGGPPPTDSPQEDGRQAR